MDERSPHPESRDLPHLPGDSLIPPVDLSSPHNVVPTSPSPTVPASTTTPFQSVHPQTIALERVSGLMLSLILLLLVVIGWIVYWFWNGADSTSFFAALGGAGAFILLVIHSYVWPPISYRHLFWRLTDHGLEIKKGVWWKEEISVPAARVQHADVSQGPLQRHFGLCTLTVHTAGKDHASVDLHGLTHEVAISIRDQVVRQHEVVDVV